MIQVSICSLEFLTMVDFTLKLLFSGYFNPVTGMKLRQWLQIYTCVYALGAEDILRYQSVLRFCPLFLLRHDLELTSFGG